MRKPHKGWKDGQYGYSRLQLGYELYLTAGWEITRPKGDERAPYEVSIFGNKLKARFDSLDEAKLAAEDAACWRIFSAVKVLKGGIVLKIAFSASGSCPGYWPDLICRNRGLPRLPQLHRTQANIASTMTSVGSVIVPRWSGRIG